MRSPDGLRRSAREASGNTQLAAQLEDAIAANKQNVDAGGWPQYWPGFYVHQFQLPIAGGPGKFPRMGQSPGTHCITAISTARRRRRSSTEWPG
jgi:hypothetical protein